MSRSGIMLCYPFEEKRYEKWGSHPIIIQPKLDGERCRAIFDSNGNVSLYSSECNLITSVPHINEQLESTHYKNIEFDGELYIHGDNFESIHSIVSRKVNTHALSEKMDYHIFDMVDETLPQVARLRALDILMSPLYLDSVKKVPWGYVTDIQTVMEMLTGYRDMGFEGMILRHPMALYTRKRSPYMMKFKPKKNDCYPIIGYQEEISIHGTPKGRLGAFILQGDDGTKFNVGTGFDDAQRTRYWQNREELIGRWCEVQYQHLTTKGKVPRFPVFVKVMEVL